MCGIIGYFSKKPTENDRFFLFKLLRQSKIRGLHSTGISYLEKSKIVTKKFFQNEFSDLKIPLSNLQIYHNRYSTSGDFKNHLNNQPLEIGDTSLCFNGVIDMGTKSQMEAKYNIKMATENDGEIALRVSNLDPQSLLNFVKNNGSFSGVMIKAGTLYAFTNGFRPLWYYEVDGSVFIASTQDIFQRAIDGCNPKQIPINTLMQWN